MRILTLASVFRSRCNGELRVIEAAREALAERGVENVVMLRSSADIAPGLAARVKAFRAGLPSRTARVEMAGILAELRPDAVHAHTLFPLYSTSVLAVCRQARVPVVMTVHNYGLTCPDWRHFHGGRVCERCLGGREDSCLLHNCRGSVVESAAFALRAALTRRLRSFSDTISVFIALTQFAARRLAAAGYPEERIEVVPNPAPPLPAAASPEGGRYVAYAGRLSEEKGVATLLAAAAGLPGIEFELAGEGPLLRSLAATAPANVRFRGFLADQEMAEFYRRARAIVVPSLWFEGCPMVILEAMTHGVPVVASRIGGLPELVRDGETGMLFEPGDVAALSAAVRTLWDDPALCARLGGAARECAAREHGRDAWAGRLLSVYARCGVPRS